MQETWVQSLIWDDPLKKGMATHSSILAHRIPWEVLSSQSLKNLPTMQLTWVQSLGWEDALEKGKVTHSCILAWRIPMDRGAWQATYSSWGCKNSDMTE